VRAAAIGVGGAFVAIQLIPFGRSHTNFTVAPPSSGAVLMVADQFCPRAFAPGTESRMSLGTLRTQLGGMVGNLDAALRSLAAGDVGGLRTQYGQFATTYGGVNTELAELYPVRCRRLLGDRLDGDAAILIGQTANIGLAAAPLTALRSGLASLSTDLNTRIQQASPDALVGNASQTVDAPLTTGTPAWDSDRTAALATRACGACHSNQPGWSWYSNVAPLSWFVQHDVDAGRAALNFSEWDRPQPAAAQAVASVQRGHMPPAWASPVRSDVRLSDAERAELARGLQLTLSGPAYTAQAPAPVSSGSAALFATLGTLLVAVGFAIGRLRWGPALRRQTFSPRRSY
jgi:hypothetical protein